MDWLQDRLDRVLIAAGQVPGSVKAVISTEPMVQIGRPGEPVAVPGALILLAPNADAVDGLMAMILSFRAGDAAGTPRPTRATVGSVLALGALVALTGGVSDPEAGRDDKVIPLGTLNDRAGPGGAPDRRQLAWRGARWHAIAGGCAEAQPAFLRFAGSAQSAVIEGRRVIWPGSRVAKEMLAGLGAQGQPGPDRCPSAADGALQAVKRQLIGSADG
ncbi:hypothetical protein GVO57_06360 [Sphingomonas changnyeongensis]|uniref:Uncharacterized protein n=1 Tax=Sphingomonas changnyeongensis TaxID=2698679 RepID=A0A7Z2NW70_9SPHN|nr:hypothetical protein [Sphingomonas changnyeongensis]QHL90534.1 hypothetical protein GVO57_06360 [Sphingomonas changnyeongensis]